MGSNRPEKGKVHIYHVQEFGGEYCQSSSKPPRGLFISNTFEGRGGLIDRDEGLN